MKLLILTQKVDTTDSNLSFFHAWIEAFAKQCERVTVVCLYEGPHHLPKNVKVLSLGKEKIPIAGRSRLKYMKRFYIYIWRERSNYDAVFVHMNQIYVILGGLLWRLWGKCVGLWYAHGSVTSSLRVATLLAHHVFTSTEGGFRIATRKKHVLRQGIDTNVFVPPPIQNIGSSNQLSLLTTGRITPVKGYEHMIEAVALLQSIHPTVHLTIVGAPLTPDDHVYEKQLRALVIDKNLSAHVTFFGPLPHKDTVTHLQSANVFLNLGQTGSLDKALLDAMACGTPAISSNEAYAGALTKYQELLVCDRNAHDLAAKVEVLVRLADTTLHNIREYCRMFVVEHHSLGTLIHRIVAILECA